MMDLNRLRELSEKALAGPWVAKEFCAPPGTYYVRDVDGHLILGAGKSLSQADAAFIVACVNQVREALREPGALSVEQVHRARYLEAGLRHVPPYYEHLNDETLTANLNAALSSKQGPPAPAVEIAWLVERRNPEPEWCSCWSGGFEWTKDSLKAIRFCRREDANQVAELFEFEDIHITEHQWG